MPGTRLINYREIKSLVENLGERQASRYLENALESKKLRAQDFSIRELAEAFMGREWVDNLHPKRGRFVGQDVLEASGDAVAYSQFSHITGQLFFSMVKENFENEQFEFGKVIPTKPSDILSMEKIPGISGVGDEFSVIGEADEYPNFGVSEDYIEAAAKAKRGGIVPVTKEAIFGDKTGKLLDEAKKVGYYLGLNKEKRLIDTVCDENGGAVSAAVGGHRYHWKGTTYATYQTSTPWDNVTASNALIDYTDVENAWLTLVGITDPYTGEPILQKPTHIIVTPQNAMTAHRILTATGITAHMGNYPTSGQTAPDIYTDSPSPLQHVGLSGLTVLTSQLLAARAATDTDWWFGAPGKAFVYLAAWDITTEDAPTNSPAAFRRDIVFETKVSEMGCAATLEPRIMTECQA